MRCFSIGRWIPEGSTEVLREGVNAVAYVRDLDGRLFAIGYHGKANTPDFHHSYPSAEARDRAVERHLDCWERHAASIAARREARKAEVAEGVDIGTIFVNAWGYEQTNVDFYEVVDVTASGKSVHLRQIGYAGKDAGANWVGPMSDHVSPKKGAFIEGAPVITKRVTRGYKDGPCVSFEHGSGAVTSESGSHYRSWYY